MEGKFILRSIFCHAGKVLTVIVKNYNGQGALQLTASHTVPLQAFELCNLCYVTHTDLPSSELLSSGFESFQNTLSLRRLAIFFKMSVTLVSRDYLKPGHFTTS